MNRSGLVIANAALLGMLAGCAATKPVRPQAFLPKDAGSHLTATLEQQAERGAANDATLYAVHFDGPALNALGQTKIESIARNAAGKFTVYVDAGGPVASARQEAVGAYLLSLGVAAEKCQVHAGTDPQSAHPVAPDLQRMAKTESGVAGGASGAPSPQQPDIAPPPAGNVPPPPDK